MSAKRPEPTCIYHFTDATNLPGILNSGCVYCKSLLPPAAQSVDVSHYDLQERRKVKRVRCVPWGVLHDYVPFYFATRSPMMYKISKGGVEGCSRDTSRLIYLVCSVQRVREAGLGFAFSDGHPIMAFSRFYNKAAELDKVDWDIMEQRYWNDTEEDNDRERRRQAEFLVHGTFPWEAVEFLAVRNRNLKDRLERYLFKEWPDRSKPVKVEADWYFP